MMAKNLLAADIGNTNITFGIIGEKGIIVKRFDVPLRSYTRAALKKKLAKAAIGNGIICSVVPSVTKKVASDLVALRRIPVSIVGEDIRVPITNRYLYPRQVGQDRLVNAYAAARLYGGPVICVDFGTAVTFDLVSKKREYLGGFILPGLRTSLEALEEKTALLPAVRLAAPKGLIGTETSQSMLSGIVYGAALMTDALTNKIRKKIGKDAPVVLTGGDAGLIGRYCTKGKKIEPDLTLKGLLFVFEALRAGDQRH